MKTRTANTLLLVITLLLISLFFAVLSRSVHGQDHTAFRYRVDSPTDPPSCNPSETYFNLSTQKHRLCVAGNRWIDEGGADSDALSPGMFGAIGDGSLHPLSQRYTTLAQAQAFYPFATSLTQQIDFAAFQQMSNVAFGAPLTIQTGYLTMNGPASTQLLITAPTGTVYVAHAFKGGAIFVRYPNGFIASVSIDDNTTTAIALTSPGLPFDFHTNIPSPGDVCNSGQLFPCSQYAIGVGEHGTAAKLNKAIKISCGQYEFGSDTWLIRNLDGGHIEGVARECVKVESNNTVLRFDGLWYSTIRGVSWQKLTSAAGNTVDIDGNVPGHPYATRSVQGNSIEDNIFSGGEGPIAFEMCRQGGAGAQCSENVFKNNHFQQADTTEQITGANALNNAHIGGNYQDFLTGAKFIGGSASFTKSAFQSTRGYLQVAAAGADIDASTFGVSDTIIDDGSDSESLVHYKGALSQIAYVRGLTQRCGSCFSWSAAANVSLNTVLQSSLNASYLYRVTTAGITGGVLPVFDGTSPRADGTAVWTLVGFSNNTVAAGCVQGISGLRGPGTFSAAVCTDDRSVEVSGLSTYAVGPGVQHVLVNAASSDVLITLPARVFAGGDAYGPRVTVSQYNGVSQAGHHVTVTAQIGIEGGDFTLAGSGGGYATFVASGGGNLTQRYYRVAETSGTGSVTNVSVTTANGVSGVVTNPTTTPAIALTLGAITPTTVTASSTGRFTALGLNTTAGSAGTLRFGAGGPAITTLQGNPFATAWTMLLPTGPGALGQFLSTDGGGVTSWVYGIGGSGTLNTIPKFTPDGAHLGNSQITTGVDGSSNPFVAFGDNSTFGGGAKFFVGPLPVTIFSDDPGNAALFTSVDGDVGSHRFEIQINGGMEWTPGDGGGADVTFGRDGMGSAYLTANNAITLTAPGTTISSTLHATTIVPLVAGDGDVGTATIPFLAVTIGSATNAATQITSNATSNQAVNYPDGSGVIALVGANAAQYLSVPVNNTVLATATGTVFASPGNDGAALSIATEGNVSWPISVPTGGRVLKNLIIRTGNTAKVNTPTTVITVRIDGVDTTLTVTMTQTVNTTNFDLTHVVALSAGVHLITVSFTTTGVAGVSTSIAGVSFEVD